jgi:hypothetical protein
MLRVVHHAADGSEIVREASWGGDDYCEADSEKDCDSSRYDGWCSFQMNSSRVHARCSTGNFFESSQIAAAKAKSRERDSAWSKALTRLFILETRKS